MTWYQKCFYVIFLYFFVVLFVDIEFNLGLFEPQVNLLNGTVGWKKCKKWSGQNFLQLFMKLLLYSQTIVI